MPQEFQTKIRAGSYFRLFKLSFDVPQKILPLAARLQKPFQYRLWHVPIFPQPAGVKFYFHNPALGVVIVAGYQGGVASVHVSP